MKLFIVHPGADTSTSDVYDGLVPALRRQGHDVLEYPLSLRWGRTTEWLKFNYRRAVKRDPTITKPTFADSVYLAGERIIPLALREQVDWVVVVSAMFLHPDWLVLLRRAGIRTAIVFTESPYNDYEQAKVAPFADAVWTNERTSVAPLRLVQPEAHYLPHAFDPAKHRPQVFGEPAAEDDVPTHDVVFVGTGFPERVALLSAVNWDGVDLGLYGNWQNLGSRHPLRRYVRGKQIPNAMTASLYRRAKIGLNLYRKATGKEPNAARIDAAESLNPRALELAACGVFHLSEPRAEVTEVFGPLVPTFADAMELEALIRGYLASDRGRREMAERLPVAVMDRTFDHMARRLMVNLQRLSYGAGATLDADAVVAAAERELVPA